MKPKRTSLGAHIDLALLLILFALGGACGESQSPPNSDASVSDAATLSTLALDDRRCVEACTTQDSEAPACEKERMVCLKHCAAMIHRLSDGCAACVLNGVANIRCSSGGTRPDGGTPDAGSQESALCCPAPALFDDQAACSISCSNESASIPSLDGPDPRCDVLCSQDEECSATTRERCLAQCEAEVLAKDNACASCLAPKASAVSCGGFNPDDPKPALCCADSFTIDGMSNCEVLCETES